MLLIPALLLLITGTSPNPAELHRRLDHLTVETESRLAAVETARQWLQAAGKKPKRDEWGAIATLVDQLESGGDPFDGQTGDLRQAYRSTVDGTLQPYRVFVPPNLEPERSYPLLVVLHGHHGDENSYFDKYRDRATGERTLLRLAEDRGYFVVAPRGRGPGSRYTDEAEQDVLDVIDRVSALYPIDERQIFLSGHSSGGVGTWKIGFRFAQRFAALAAVGSAFRYQPAELSRLPLADSPAKPLLYVQGRQDHLATNRYAANLVDFLGPRLQNFVYKEFPDGHNSLGTTSLPTVFDFFDSVRQGDELMSSDTVSPPKLVAAASRKRSARYRAVPKRRTVAKRTATKRIAAKRTPARHIAARKTPSTKKPMARRSVTPYKKGSTKARKK
ncbi:MAG: alpha/beta fold hydrolase [Bryobacteraceae bacterium]